MWKRNLRSLEVQAKMKCGSGLIHIWKSWQNKCGRRRKSFEVLTERKYGKRNFRSLAVNAEQKCGSGSLEVPAEVKYGSGSSGGTSAEEERDLSTSWPSGSMESGTSDLWQ